MRSWEASLAAVLALMFHGFGMMSYDIIHRNRAGSRAGGAHFIAGVVAVLGKAVGRGQRCKGKNGCGNKFRRFHGEFPLRTIVKTGRTGIPPVGSSSLSRFEQVAHRCFKTCSAAQIHKCVLAEHSIVETGTITTRNSGTFGRVKSSARLR
jgi:hypothetical protein